MKKITALSLLAIMVTTHLNGRWIAFKNSTPNSIDVNLTTHSQFKREPKTVKLTIEAHNSAVTEVFTKRLGGKGNYLTNLKISWSDGRQPSRIDLDLARINTYIMSLTDKAAKNNPQATAIAITYDADRIRGRTPGSWIKDMNRDHFKVSSPTGKYDPVKAEGAKRAAEKAAQEAGRRFLRLPKRRRRP